MTDVIDFPQPADEEQGDALPVILGGGPIHRCYQCGRAFTPATYHVILELNATSHLNVCRRCAGADPDFSHWEDFCDIADMIDAVMRTAPDKRTRGQLTAMIRQCAEHFAVWRWPDEDADHADDGAEA